MRQLDARRNAGPMNAALLDHLRAARQERGASHRQLARATGLDPRSLQRAFSGEHRSMNVDSLAQCFEALGYELGFYVREKTNA